MSGIKGSCGFGSARRDATERRTLMIERAGDHWFLSCGGEVWRGYQCHRFLFIEKRAPD